MALTLSLPLVGQAQEIPEDFPNHQTVFIDSERFEAFNLGNFSSLLEAYIERDFLRESRALLLQENETLQEQASYLRLALAESHEIIEEYKTETSRLLEKWKEESRLRLEAENSLFSGNVIWWVLTGVLGVTTLVLGGIVVAGGL